MKARLNMSLAVAVTALIMLTGCVSNRKYKASQAELAKVRSDSAQLAQQVTSLNGNVQDLQGRNTSLQRSLDSSSNSYAAQQKSLNYYQGYFKAQQDTLAQVSGDLKNALTAAGVSNGDVQQTNNAIYVRFDENELFKKNSTMVTPVGKQALNGLVQVIRNRSNVNVAVSSGDSATGWVSADNMSTGNMASDETMRSDAGMSSARRHHKAVRTGRGTASTTSGGAPTASNGSAQTAGASGSSVAAITNGGGSKRDAKGAHRKIHHRYSSESSMAMYSGPGHMHNHAWALKQGRMVMVADHFLKNGAPMINVTLQQPPMDGAPKNTAIQIIITPKTDNFNPQNNPSSATR